MQAYLRDYLEAVGIVDGVSAHTVPCEVCGCPDHMELVREVETGPDRFGTLPVVACVHCGFVYQNPRFNKAFYDTYYDQHYRRLLFGDTQPERDFIHDQVRRGEHLVRNLQAHLPEKGRLLDVGCSAGGLMVAFAKRGWEVLGTDPDGAYADYGRSRLGLDVRAMPAEDMELPQAHFDLIVITGSLEHVFDVNRVLALCRSACAPSGALFIEGRAWRYGLQKGFFSHNHRRYLNPHAIELLMLKHGWTPTLSTDQALCGPTRPGGVYVLGRASEPFAQEALMREIAAGRRDDAVGLRRELGGLRGVA